MKKGLLLLAVSLMTIPCAAVSFKALYEDQTVYAELAVDDNDWVVLTIKNNSASPIQLLAEKSYYSNVVDAMNTLLVPISDQYNPGLKIVPIPIPSGRTVVQKFAAPAFISYKKGKIDDIENWTPRSKKKIKTAVFDFEYEIEGKVIRFSFDGNKFS